MLPKKNRLTVSQFNQIPQKSAVNGHLFLNIKVKNNPAGNSRFVFVVPKSLDKRSSVRHLAKRITEELVREKIKKMKTSKCFLIKLKKIITKKDRFKLGEELDCIL